jgi:hypothetical protein
MSTYKIGNPWKTGKTNSERKGCGEQALGRRGMTFPEGSGHTKLMVI